MMARTRCGLVSFIVPGASSPGYRMKSLGLLLCGALLTLVATTVAEARLVRIWSEEELFSKSDLVVLATPIATTDTAERGRFPSAQFSDQPVIGVNTICAVKKVLKAENGTAAVTLHHYRPDRMSVLNGPGFVDFEPNLKQAFRLY